MKTQISVNQIEITEIGHIQVRLSKEICDDAGNVIGYAEPRWHRTAIEIGGDVDAQMQAVNAHLETMGFPAVSAEDISQIAAHSVVAWTPTKVAAWNAAKAADIARQESLAADAARLETATADDKAASLAPPA